MAETLAKIAVIALGLAAGALLAEGGAMVPYWRSLPPADFLRFYAANAARLFNFFAPLVMAAAVFTIGAAVALRRRPGAGPMAAASVLMVAVLLTFPIYFRDVNVSFEQATIAPDQITAELARWAAWHWARTAMSIAAFVASLASILQATQGERR